jgi:transposase
MDVPQESRAGASVAHASGAEVVALGTIGTRQGDLDGLSRKRHPKRQPLVCVDAAGPCGYWRSRDLVQTGYVCWVVAPSLMPQKAGDRVQTDRRDAVHLARLRRSGDLTPVDVPRLADDASRARTRARAEARRDLKTAKCRLNALLRRQAMRDTGPAHGRPAHRRWRAEVVCPTPAQQSVCQAYVRAVTEPTARLRRLEQALHEQVTTWRLAPVVEALQALRGVQCTVAVTLVAERGALPRVETPCQLMKYRGLTPSAYASGARRRQGGLTTTGHLHARRALLEGAWASRSPANVSRPLQRRRAKLPQDIQDLRWKAPVRWCTRYRPRGARGTHAHHVVVALARERAAFLWAIAPQGFVTPEAWHTCVVVAIRKRLAVHRQRRSPGRGSSSTA